MSSTKKTRQVIKFETQYGGGEAIKESRGEAWYIMAPIGDLRFYGTVYEVKREIKKFVGGTVNWI